MYTFGPKDYHDGIARLNRGLKQLQGDGKNCAICEDGGHQAWECHFNPLFMEKLAWKVYGGFWKCFHCGEIFTDDDKAREHFGSDAEVATACLVDVSSDTYL